MEGKPQRSGRAGEASGILYPAGSLQCGPGSAAGLDQLELAQQDGGGRKAEWERSRREGRGVVDG